MSVIRRIDKGRLKKIATLLLGVVFFLWYSVNRTVFFKTGFSERIVATCMYPFIRLSAAFSDVLTTYTLTKKSYHEVCAENQTLRETCEALQAALIDLKSTITFDSETQEIRDFRKRFDLSNALLTKVLVRTMSPQEHTVIINCGSRNGVKKDMVGVYKLQIVGRVIEVFDYYSKMQLITDAHSKVAAHANTTGAGGIVTGVNKPNVCQFNYVSYINHLQQDDLVFTSGQGMVFPEGFCLGKISKLVVSDKALYHDVEVTPLVDLTTLKYCLLTDQTKISLL